MLGSCSRERSGLDVPEVRGELIELSADVGCSFSLQALASQHDIFDAELMSLAGSS